MTRGFLSEGGGRRESESDGDVTVHLECGWSTEKAWGFRKNPGAPRSGGAREELIWIPKQIRGEPLTWTGTSTGPGKLTGPRWLLEKNGLL